MKPIYYQCSQCGREYEITPDLMVCPVCSQTQLPNEPLRGILEIQYQFAVAKPSLTHLLPVEARYFPAVPVGNTPLWQAERLNTQLGFKQLFFKDDTHNLTGSFKDRASWLVAAFARRFDIHEVTVASTGNAASSMAGIGAAAGLRVTIFLPESAPPAKMIQSLQYGARVIPVAGSYDLAFDLSLQYSRRFHILCRNTAYNPLTIEGKKTAALEIVEQLGRAPDYVFIPTGDGVILSGIGKGFKDLLKMEIIDHLPTLVAVQAHGSDAITRAWESGRFTPLSPQTIADSIAVGIPRCGWYALQHLRACHGRCITVTDTQILAAQKALSSQAGLFAEPAAAAAFAGFLKLHSELPPDSLVVVLITGNGLKDIASARQMVDFPSRSIRSLEELT